MQDLQEDGGAGALISARIERENRKDEICLGPRSTPAGIDAACWGQPLAEGAAQLWGRRRRCNMWSLPRS